MVAYHIFMEDRDKVTSRFEQFTNLYSRFADIFKEITEETYIPGCKYELENVKRSSVVYRKKQKEIFEKVFMQ